MSLKEQAKKKKSKALEKMGDIYKEFLQSYLAWLYLQNPRFDEFLTNEELTNYLFNEIYIRDITRRNRVKKIQNYFCNQPL